MKSENSKAMNIHICLMYKYNCVATLVLLTANRFKCWLVIHFKKILNLVLETKVVTSYKSGKFQFV